MSVYKALHRSEDTTLPKVEKTLEKKGVFLTPEQKELVAKFVCRTKGTKGAPQKRERFVETLVRMLDSGMPERVYRPKEVREKEWKTQKALELAKKAGQYFDEHGGVSRGDHLKTDGLDYVSPYHGSLESPYFDMGGEGLGLIRITRKRIYASSSGWYPSYCSTTYLIGRNESGTYFAHAVPRHIETVYEAVQWIWNGRAEQIISRQGDIALIWGRGPKLPELPHGHEVKNGYIVHESHPPLPLPGKGQRIIVGRRAVVRVSDETRD